MIKDMATLKRRIRHILRRVDPRYLLSPFFLSVCNIDEIEIKGDKRVLYKRSEVDVTGIDQYEHMPSTRKWKDDTYNTPEVYAIDVADVEYYTGGTGVSLLLWNEDKIISEATSTMSAPKYFRWDRVKRAKRREIGEYVSALRYVSNNYYHTIIDNLPRVVALNKYSQLYNQKVTLIVPGKLTDVERYCIERLVDDQVDIRELDEGYKYKIHNYCFISFATEQFIGYVPEWYKDEVQKKMLPKRASKRSRRIYVSRKDAEVRRIKNEEQLIVLLNKYGFEEYELSSHSIDRQIEVFYDADAVVAPHGAGLANMIFSNELSVLELFPTRTIKPNYFFIAKSLGHEYQCITCNAGHINDDFYVDLGKVSNWLEALGYSRT